VNGFIGLKGIGWFWGIDKILEKRGADGVGR